MCTPDHHPEMWAGVEDCPPPTTAPPAAAGAVDALSQHPVAVLSRYAVCLPDCATNAAAPADAEEYDCTCGYVDAWNAVFSRPAAADAGTEVEIAADLRALEEASFALLNERATGLYEPTPPVPPRPTPEDVREAVAQLHGYIVVDGDHSPGTVYRSPNRAACLRVAAYLSAAAPERPALTPPAGEVGREVWAAILRVRQAERQVGRWVALKNNEEKCSAMTERGLALGALWDALAAQAREAEVWREAIVNASLVAWTYTGEHDDDPRAAVNALLVHAQNVALDPAVSEPARVLHAALDELRADLDFLAPGEGDPVARVSAEINRLRARVEELEGAVERFRWMGGAVCSLTVRYPEGSEVTYGDDVSRADESFAEMVDRARVELDEWHARAAETGGRA